MRNSVFIGKVNYYSTKAQVKLSKRTIQNCILTLGKVFHQYGNPVLKVNDSFQQLINPVQSQTSTYVNK